MNRPILTIKQDIEATEAALAKLANIPNTGALKAAVQQATTEALIDPSKRDALLWADQALKDAEAQLVERSKMNGQLQRLTLELSVAEAEERQVTINTANGLLDKAISRYNHSAMQCCRDYEALLVQQKRNQQVPGAKSAIPAGPNFPQMLPMGWQGTTAEFIKTGSLYWLNKEKEQGVAA